MINDTIVALSTAPIVGAIGIVRLSGSKSFEILKNITKCDIPSFDKRTILFRKIYDNLDTLIDEVVVNLYKNPHSFTGEDVVEINCHGSLFVINQIIQLCISFGARMAQRGEFSKKAFYNGKIDLIQAESINDLIMSKNELSSKLALKGLNGNTSNKLRELKNKLVNLIALIDVNIDYPEYEDIEQLSTTKLKDQLEVIIQETNKIIKDSNKGLLIKEGIRTAIIGKPNAGKSSILNCLIGEEKAIVTEIEGTTRDIVEGNIMIEGIPFVLLDTAGFRESNNLVEAIGIEKSKQAIEKANLVILVIDGSKSLNEQRQDLKEFSNIDEDKLIVVVNKSDISKESIDGIKVSALKNNIEELKNKMISFAHKEDLDYDDLSYLSNERQIGLIKKSYNQMMMAMDSIENFIDIDMIEIEVRAALDAINEILGDKTKEDIDNEIFSKFCIGK